MQLFNQAKAINDTAKRPTTSTVPLLSATTTTTTTAITTATAIIGYRKPPLKLTFMRRTLQSLVLKENSKTLKAEKRSTYTLGRSPFSQLKSIPFENHYVGLSKQRDKKEQNKLKDVSPTNYFIPFRYLYVIHNVRILLTSLWRHLDYERSSQTGGQTSSILYKIHSSKKVEIFDLSSYSWVKRKENL
uniref:Uncharacterized protein n=1 Tax=Glossina brevipalpis TaxID=37001 RepID=A0A1A9WL90_9MUSC